LRVPVIQMDDGHIFCRIAIICDPGRRRSALVQGKPAVYSRDGRQSDLPPTGISEVGKGGDWNGIVAEWRIF